MQNIHKDIEEDVGLLRFFKSHPEYVSGEKIGSELKLSRAAVWKHIEKLRRVGFSIEAAPHRGYYLKSFPDKLLPALIKDELKTKLVGKKIFYFPRTTSTNNLAKDFAKNNAFEGSIIIAEEQTQGRGRLGRRWISPKGKSIILSIILRPQIPPHQIYSLTMLCSLAVSRAISSIINNTVYIKWPNDLVINNKKVGGILTEFDAEQDKLNFVVVGIGINVNFNPRSFAEIKDTATSISNETSENISRLQLLCRILEEIELLYFSLNDGEIEKIRQQWDSLLSIHGKWVRVNSFDGVVEGIAESVDKNGALILRIGKGKRVKVQSGDVSLRES